MYGNENEYLIKAFGKDGEVKKLFISSTQTRLINNIKKELFTISSSEKKDGIEVDATDEYIYLEKDGIGYEVHIYELEETYDHTVYI